MGLLKKGLLQVPQSGGSATWGSITGTLSSQTDLQNALNNKADLVDGMVPSSQLPSYVDDVIVVASFSALPVVGETSKIYVTIDTNLTYRWNGVGYSQLDSGLALGETALTAYRGDRGKEAYDHTSRNDNPHSVTKAQVGLSNVDNTSDIDKPISNATQTALNSKEPIITGGLASKFWNGLKQFVDITADNIVTNSLKRFISDTDFIFFSNKAEKRDLISFTYTRNREGFSTNITSSTALINIFQYLIGTPAGTVATTRNEQQLNQTVDFTFNTTNPLSPTLIFPAIDGEVDYKIRLLISGTFSGSATIPRIMPIDIQRVSDNSLLGGVKHVKDLNDNNIVNEFIEFTTRTIGASDNFSVNGIRLLIQQNTSATLTLTRCQLYISANVIRLGA